MKDDYKIALFGPDIMRRHTLYLRIYNNNRNVIEINVDNERVIKTRKIMSSKIESFNLTKEKNKIVMFYSSATGINAKCLDKGWQKLKPKTLSLFRLEENIFNLLTSDDDFTRLLGYEVLSSRICEVMKVEDLYELTKYIVS